MYRDVIYEGQTEIDNFPETWKYAFLKTAGIIYHREQIGLYTAADEPSTSNYDYKNEVVAYNSLETNYTSSDFNSLKDAHINSVAKYVTVSNKLTSPNFSDNNNILLEQRNSTGKIIAGNEGGNGLILSKDAKTIPSQEVEYRYAVLGIYNNSNFVTNIYVKDNILQGTDLSKLITNLNGNSQCYVSNIVASRTRNTDSEYKYAFEIAKSARNFFSKYPYNDTKTYNALKNSLDDSGGAGYIWSKNVKGVEEGTNAMGSVLNQYDNILHFPQWTKREVIVRHINIGNNTTISTEIINNGTRITPTNPTLTLTNPASTIKSEAIPSNRDGEEYYTEVMVHQGVQKSPLSNTSRYECIGYNVSLASSYEQAKNDMATKISQGSYTKYASKSVEVQGKEVTANDDCIIIDFYYTTHDKDVYVNHVYLDKNGYVLNSDEQTITPNKTATMNNKTINNISNKTYIEEKYSKIKGYSVNTRIADSLVNELNKKNKVFYLGYESFNEYKDINSIIGKQIVISNNNKSENVAISGNMVQVNYYYYIDMQVQKEQPAKDINGKVFAELTGNSRLEGECTDAATGFNITSYPTETNLKLGIKDIPLGMIGAIRTQYSGTASNSSTINVKLNIASGGKSKTVSYDNIKYAVGYYKITDMLVHKLKQITIYDADSQEAKTLGDNLFSNWENNKKVLNPTNIDLNLEIIGINGKIGNNEANINNPANYIKIYVKDNYGNINSKNVNGTITMNYQNNSKITASKYQEILSTDSSKEIAKVLGLKLVVEVKNATVKINGEEINSNNKVTREIDLSNYSSSETHSITTSLPTFKKEKYQSIGNIKEADYNNSNKIDKNILNGLRAIAGKAEYESVIVIGDEAQTNIIDTGYYADQSTDKQTVVFKAEKQNITKLYEINTQATNATDKYKDVALLNVYTPITVTTSFKSENNKVVDQTQNNNNITASIDTKTVQINTPFTITLNNDDRESVYNLNSTKQYNLAYYVKFDFDVHQVKLNGIAYKSSAKVSAGTWVGPIYRNKKDKATITAQAYGDLKNGQIITEENNSYTVRAVAHNINENNLKLSLDYSNIEDMLTYSEALRTFMNNICNSSSYIAETTEQIALINRLYDFRVTDLKDLGWKSVFRKSSSNVTNAHTNNVYYAGTTKWNASSEKINEIINRTSSEIGRNPVRTLPIGPYKNTDTSYIKAPKLGYRFSFDMKVTGAYSKDKKVEITTDFYYISKDGKTFIEEYNGKAEGIYLFYKNSSGKYIRIDDKTGGAYNLTFIPNDGYRYIQDTDKSTLATTTLSLGNLRKITLNSQMATIAEGGSHVTYYGEYKLPNSTIAVKVNNDGTYDINKPLTDGYIGVIFNINAYSGKIASAEGAKDVILSYSKDTNGVNTSQWDYEGFLGHTKYGNEVINNTISLKLEKGKWKITNDIYQKIKGSVILYDIDQRAATDYE